MQDGTIIKDSLLVVFSESHSRFPKLNLDEMGKHFSWNINMRYLKEED